MSDTKASIRRPRWGRRVALGIAVLVALLIMAFLGVTSSAFLKGVMLPRAGEMLDAKISAGELVFRPFSGLVARDVKVVPNGAEPFFELGELRVRYRLASLLSGKPEIHEITLMAPKVHVVQKADGTSNLTPIQKALEKFSKAAKPEPPGSASTPFISVKAVTLEGGTFRFSTKTAAGGSEVLIDKIRLTLDQLQNGQPGKLGISAALSLAQTLTVDGKPKQNSVAARLDATVGIQMDAQLVPAAIAASLRAAVESGTGDFAALKDAKLELEGDLVASELKKLNLSLMRGSDVLAAFKASGPLNLASKEAKLSAEVLAVDRKLLNLIGTAANLDFLDTTVAAKFNLDSTKGGQAIETKGEFRVGKLGVRRLAETTPQMDIDIAFNGAIDNESQSLVLKELDLAGSEGGRRVLSAHLARPLMVIFGGATPGIRGSDFELTLDRVDMAKWKPLAGDSLPSGLVTAALKLVANQDGRTLSGSSTVQWDRFSMRAPSGPLQEGVLQFKSGFRIRGLDDVVLDSASVSLSQGSSVLTTLSASGLWSGSRGEFGAHCDVVSQVGPLAKFLNRSDVQFTEGEAKIAARVSGAKGVTKVTANAALTRLTGRAQAFRFEDYGAAASAEGDWGTNEVSVTKASLSLRKGSKEGGVVNLSGAFSRSTQTGRAEFQVTNLNQIGLGPFLIGTNGKSIVASISIASSGSFSMNSKSETQTKGDVVVTDLSLLTEGKGSRETRAPLSASLAFDAAGRGRSFDLKQIKLTLPPTQRAGNEVVVTGKLDFQSTDAAPSQISMTSDSFDVTQVVDFLSEASGAMPSNQVESSSKKNVLEGEPSAVHIPLSNLTADVRFGKLFIRDLALSNVVTTLKIQTNVVRLDPFQMVCNGAAVTASSVVDLSKPGFVYDIKLRADSIPIEPLANSFAPAYKGHAQGELSAFAEIQGAGVTDLSLQKNLLGKATVSFTNANIQLVGPKIRLLLTPIAMLLRVPELLQSPMNGFHAQFEVAKGNLEVRQVELRTGAFQATTAGTIPLQAILTNSPLNLPIVIALKRSIAQKSNLISAKTPTNAAFVTLPTFATAKGTLGAPETKTDGLVLAGLGLKSVLGLPLGVGEKSGNILQGIGNLLTGEKSAPATPAQKPELKTTAPAKINPLDLLRLIPEKKEKKP